MIKYIKIVFLINNLRPLSKYIFSRHHNDVPLEGDIAYTFRNRFKENFSEIKFLKFLLSHWHQ